MKIINRLDQQLNMMKNEFNITVTDLEVDYKITDGMYEFNMYYIDTDGTVVCIPLRNVKKTDVDTYIYKDKVVRDMYMALDRKFDKKGKANA